MTPWLLAVVFGVALVGFALDRMAVALLRPQRRPVGQTPGDVGVHARAFTLRDEPALEGWWMEGGRPGGPVVVLAHGWGANAGALLSLAPALLPVASHLVAADVRGHGRSAHAPVVSIRHFRDDLVRVLQHVREQAPDTPLVLAGHSMGGAAGILAAEATGIVGALALIAAPHDVFGTVARYLGERGIPGHLLVPLFVPSWRLRIGEPAWRLDPGRALASMSIPTLVVQPADDVRVPPSEGAALARAAGVDVATIPGAGHSDVLTHPETGRLLGNFVAGLSSS